jgi:lipopolysaccharide/colanic/teichoic acid biosynthesis glycosyltransferase
MGIFSRLAASMILIILLPIILIISLICFLFQGPPVFYRQSRIGYKFKRFKIYKFRTMVKNTGDLITTSNDNRITFIGNVLRKAKIDEIPQLLNIIKGEMRFIGPRPEVQEYIKKENFQFLNIIKPGLSDYSSIIFRDESKILKNIGGSHPYRKLLPIKLELAEYYSKKKCFILDLKLVLTTLLALIFPGISMRVFIFPNILKDLPNVKQFLDNHLNV